MILFTKLLVGKSKGCFLGSFWLGGFVGRLLENCL